MLGESPHAQGAEDVPGHANRMKQSGLSDKIRVVDRIFTEIRRKSAVVSSSFRSTAALVACFGAMVSPVGI